MLKLQEHQNELYHELEDVQAQVRRSKQEMADLTAELTEEKDKNRNHQASAASLTLATQSQTSQIQVKKMARDQLNGENASLEKRSKELKKELVDIESLRTDNNQKLTAQEEISKKLNEELHQHTISLENETAKGINYKKQGIALQSQFEQTSVAAEDARVAVKKLEKHVAQVKKEIVEADEAKESLETDNKIANEKKSKLEQQHKTLTAQLEEAKATLAKLLADVATLNEKLGTGKGNLEALLEKLVNLDKHNNVLSNDIQSVRTESDIIKENLDKLNKKKTKFETDIAQATDNLAQEKTKSQASKEATAQLVSSQSQTKEKISAEEVLKNTATRAIEKLKEEISKLSEGSESTKGTTTAHTTKAAELAKKEKELKERLEELKEEKTALLTATELNAGKKTAILSDIQDQSEAHKRTNDQIRKRSGEIDEIKVLITTKESANLAENRKLDQVTAQLKEKKDAIEDLKKKQITLEKVGSDLQAKIKMENGLLAEKQAKKEKQEASHHQLEEKVEGVKDKIDDAKEKKKLAEIDLKEWETKVASLKEDIAQEQRLKAKLKQDAIDAEEAIAQEQVEQEQASIFTVLEETERKVKGQLHEAAIALESQKKESEKAIHALRDVETKRAEIQETLRHLVPRKKLQRGRNMVSCRSTSTLLNSSLRSKLPTNFSYNT